MINKDLSVIIINYNTKGLLKDCLWSIYKWTRDINFEVFVVDNNSKDGSIQMVKENFSQVRLIINNKNVGYAKANNQAMELSAGRYILLLNSDTKIIDNSLKKLVLFMNNTPDAGMAGPKLLNKDGSLQYSCRNDHTISSIFFNKLQLDKIFPENRIFGYHRMTYWSHNSTRKVDYVPGACLIVRKKIIKKVGMFDDDFFMFFEDADWCIRVREAGWKVYYTHDIQIYHYKGKSNTGLKGLFNGQLCNDKSLLKYFKKHKSMLDVILLYIIVPIGWLILLAIKCFTVPKKLVRERR